MEFSASSQNVHFFALLLFFFLGSTKQRTIYLVCDLIIWSLLSDSIYCSVGRLHVRRYSEVTRKQIPGQEKVLAAAPSGWRSSRDALCSTFPPPLLPCAFVSKFLACLFSHLPLILLNKYLPIWLPHSDISSVSRAKWVEPLALEQTRAGYNLHRYSACRHPCRWSSRALRLRAHCLAFIQSHGCCQTRAGPLFWAGMTRLCGPGTPRPPLSPQAEYNKVTQEVTRTLSRLPA